MNHEELLGSLALNAAVVASEADEATSAAKRLLVAKTELFERVIEVVRPALRAISTRPRVSSRTFWPDRACAETENTRASWRGICLSSDEAGPDEDYPRANDGSYEGRELWLADDGRLVRITYSGTWSRWQGAASSWEADVMTYADIATALEDWPDVDEYVARLAAALQKAVGSRAKAAKAATERAEKLEAVARIVRR